jgi:hypothetical protein
VQNSKFISDIKKLVCNERIDALKFKLVPVRILIMQVYIQTSEYEDDKVEMLYDSIEEILEEEGKGDTNTIILGDRNSVVGDGPYRNSVGSRGLGRRNCRDQMLIDFCEGNGLIVTNACFKKPRRKLYTWKAPGD